jgi:hypothetical protein
MAPASKEKSVEKSVEKSGTAFAPAAHFWPFLDA